MVSKIYHVVDTERGNVRKDGFKCRSIPVYIRDGSKLHVTLPFEMADDSRNAGTMQGWRFSLAAFIEAPAS